MADFDFDLFVIGGGSGGVRAARMAALTGARVGLAEEFRYGGTCVVRGCVPKKLMVYASAFAEAFEDAEGFGWSVPQKPVFDWSSLIAAKDAEIARLEGLYAANLDRTGVHSFSTRATLASAHEVRLATGETFTARHILIATGGRPFLPQIPGIGHAVSSNEMFDLPAQPGRVLIVGGGYIACEFAGILNGLGSAVTLAYRRDLVLRGFDADVRTHVAAEMAKKGIAFRYGGEPAAITPRAGGGFTVEMDDGGEVETDLVFFATGRVPNTAGLGLEEVGVALTPNGAVKVDAFSQSSVPSIYAVGDVTDRLALTPVAIREGMAFVDTVFRATPTSPDHDLVPTAVFTQPEIGTVGMSEEEARAQGPVEIYRSSFRPMLHTLSGRDERMLMKLVVARESRRVLGCHIVGHGAGEMIQLAGIAVKMGATKEDFDRTCAVHPTAAEELVTMREPVAET
ncbi:glutathione-disulfide reductase [Paroceanicella profunda]|uniref:Glutathione reductase n=1 Tax=Paroceanicella profunda TaxID=2579971 RepID=A0A5B8FZL2_9RHOB|nr:glutathione-disulfide reductase [Paroceanicella profunda]QDL92830.1 glutathione-disulfide reductase [Paroceanicella profunda]